MTYQTAIRSLRFARIVLLASIASAVVLLAVPAASAWQIAFEAETAALACVLTVLGFRVAERGLDRHYHRETHDAERVLSEMGHAISGIRDPEDVIETVCQRLTESLHAQPIHILRTADPVLAVCPGILRHLHRLQAPAKVDFSDPQSWIHGLNEGERETLRTLQARILVPMLLSSDKLPAARFVGVLACGPKRWDMPFSRAELQLISAAALQTALALDNARLIDDIRAQVAARERLNRELEIAREVQQRLFPQSAPSVTGIELAGHCRPASSVGGDYFDFLLLDDGCLAIAIGDVSGKGIAAALTMASLQACLRTQTLTAVSSLSDAVRRVNRLMHDTSASNRYVTFFFAIYDSAARRLAYVNAGHNSPMLFRNGSVLRLNEGGTVIGLFPDAPYTEGVVEMQSGDLLVAFTDGITEAHDSSDVEFGEDSLTEAVQAYRTEPCASLIGSLFRRIDDFTGSAPQHDDMTTVLLRVI